ncbi:MAG: right-handed parallel beta-helix repeat-containing protein [Prevotella sp.]|jgi:hypothetical protein|nr:right-handed parallel beta-helix repeat-containing protein [Prevotella sp.]MCI1686418.1 right-handed parallel beta-helix repeat-containing protein [Prevotella sp.]MCI1780581.1 right-handed parallel beta-helix repeat-containing protein [Prevotella sp.]MCI1816507.1 right-handed parallel beta-helix repeat-containing protein [Prevotella sp.]MCI2138382.1 right-handed parallel beta-helix repeat-containing protein [Prevotella sp.]
MRKIYYKYLLCLFLFISCTCQAQNKTYYVSPEGNDNSSGLSAITAWKSINKVNGVIFKPGDKILFEKMGIWHGQLRLQGSGIAGDPIILSSYGEGTQRPVINMGDAEGAAILLHNRSWWEIRNMEVTSGYPPRVGIGRQGIVAEYDGEKGSYQHIIVENCYVHDIWGQMGGMTAYTGYNSCGIYIHVKQAVPSDVGISLNDVLVSNNIVKRFDKCGILVIGAKNNVIVRHNYVQDLGGDGIFVSGTYRGLIEYNIARETCERSGYDFIEGDQDWWPHTAAIWIQFAKETILQYNQVYDTGRQSGNGDGEAYDFDFYCEHCIAQYNYSKNNHGFLLIMNRTFENVARYNISENDQSHLIQMQCALDERNMVNNNVFYIDRSTVDLDFFCGDNGSVDPKTLGAIIQNNIFYSATQSSFRTVYTRGKVLHRIFNDTLQVAQGTLDGLFYNNCYFGRWKNGVPNDPKRIIKDPLFVLPGNGGEGLKSLDGYRLRSGSPCISAGCSVIYQATHDFWGNLIKSGSVDIGANEVTDANRIVKDNANLFNQTESKKTLICYSKWVFPIVIDISANKNIAVNLLQLLNKDIEGYMYFNTADKKRYSIDCFKKNKLFLFKYTRNIKPSFLHVHLNYDHYSKDWDIPCITR